MLPKFNAVILDMDGLVLDTEATYICAWRQATELMGYQLADPFWHTLSGLTGDAVQQLIQTECGQDFVSEQFQRMSSACWQRHVQQHGISVKPGFEKLLHLLKQLDLPYCLATNSPRQAALNCLSLAGLSQVFQIILTRDEVAAGKPAPDIFLQAAAVMGVEPGDCLVLEDSPVGVAAAVAANCPCFYVPSVYPADEWAAEKALGVVSNLEQVAQLISLADVSTYVG